MYGKISAMIPQYPEFKSIDPEDLKLTAKNNPKICEFAPANFLIWKDFDNPVLTIINNNLCILVSPPNEPRYFLEPFGSNKLLETVETCLKHCGIISRATESFAAKIPVEKYRIKCLRNHFDYIYETKTLADLKGRRFDGKRNHIRNFKQRHPDYEYILLGPELKNACLDLFEEWFLARKESRHFPKLAYTSQKQALENAFANYRFLNIQGGALIINDKVKGFIMASRLNRDTASVHFQYGHPALRGIFQTLLYEACNKTFSNFKYLNLEQDLGIPGLRKAKLSYYPLKLEKKFEISPRQSNPKQPAKA
jgi:hypothetical protein